MPADFWSSHIDDLLPAYHNGTLSADDRMRVDAHLRRCAACQMAAADWGAVANAIGEPASIQPANLPNWIADITSEKEQDVMQPPAFSLSRSAPTRSPGHLRRFATFAPAMLLVIVVVLAVAATRLLQGGDDPSPTLPAMAAQGSPAVECTLEASSLDRLTVSGDTLYSDALQVSQRSSEEAFTIAQRLVPTGDAASPTEIDGVQQTLDQLVACINSGSKEQTISAFTDDYLRRLRVHNFSLELGSLSAFIPTYGSNSSTEIARFQVDQVVVLPDGRLSATVTGPTGGDAFGPSLGVSMVFVQQGDRWLVDEAAPISTGDAMTPVAIDTYEAELSVSDDGFTPASLDVPPGRIVVTVTNTGSEPHSVVIPEHYIRIDVGPGESKQFQITRQAGSPFRGEGVITFRSDLPGDTADAFTGQIVVGSGVPATPAEGETNPYASTFTLLPTASTTIALPVAANLFEPAVVPILADRDVQVTLINTNSSGIMRFVIRELGIDVELGPGETTAITINAPAGVYAFYSPLGDDLRNGAFGTLVVLTDDRPMNGGIDNS